jgi:hypothetical protein
MERGKADIDSRAKGSERESVARAAPGDVEYRCDVRWRTSL